MCAADGELTDGGENAGEAEIVDGVEREQVEEELLLLLLTSQEGVALVQLPVDTAHHSWVRSGSNTGKSATYCSTPRLLVLESLSVSVALVSGCVYMLAQVEMLSHEASNAPNLIFRMVG